MLNKNKQNSNNIIYQGISSKNICDPLYENLTYSAKKFFLIMDIVL